MIGIIDYRLGNVKAFANIYKELGVGFTIATTPKDLAKVSKVIVPGVGAFDQAMKRLEESGMRDQLDELVLHKKLPVLGVCVGMQILMAGSEEGLLPGLGWIEGTVVKFQQPSSGNPIQVPHMGWNEVVPVCAEGLFKGLAGAALFYFLHSYYTRCAQNADVLASTQYGSHFTSAVGKGNVFGVQFHPEKSHHDGVQLLKNFAEL